MKKDAYYFPHFCNARGDRKIKRLTKDLGVEGYGLYFMLLEVLREQEGFRFPLADVDLLADEFRTSEAKLKTVLSNYSLFEIDEKQMFFSPKFDEYMEPYLKMKNQRIEAAKKSVESRRKKIEIAQTIVERPLNDRKTNAETTVQTTVKQSKEKKSKEKDITHFANTCFSFEEFWETYKRKKDRARAEKVYSKISEANRQKIKDTLEAYVQNTEVQFRKYPVSYLNGENWNDEINVSVAAGGPMATKPRVLNRVQD